jgi:membrane protease YdiL (CAAX protease family)
MIDVFLPHLATDAVFLMLPFLWAVRNKKPVKEAFGIRRISLKKAVVYSAAIFTALLAAAFIAGTVIEAADLNDTALVAETLKEMATLSPLLLPYLVIVRVFSEEVLFRAFLVERVGIIPSTLLFAAVHAGYNSVAEVLGAFVLGLVLAVAYSRTRNIMPVFAAHAGFNMVMIIGSGAFI